MYVVDVVWIWCGFGASMVEFFRARLGLTGQLLVIMGGGCAWMDDFLLLWVVVGYIRHKTDEHLFKKVSTHTDRYQLLISGAPSDDGVMSYNSLTTLAIWGLGWLANCLTQSSNQFLFYLILFCQFQDKNGTIKVANQVCRFKVVQNRPSKFDRIKAETETEDQEIKKEEEGDDEDEAPRKTFKEIQVSKQ